MSVSDIICHTAIPNMVEVKQSFERKSIPPEAIAGVVYEQMKLSLKNI